jgi:tetratricopeptide (TPR) repeat protein
LMLQRTRLHHRFRQYPEIIDSLDRFFEAHQEVSQFHFEMKILYAQSLLQVHRFGEALVAWRLARDLYASLGEQHIPVEVFSGEGRTLLSMGEYSDALPILQTAHQMNPEDEYIRKALAHCESYLGLKDADGSDLYD